MSGQSLRRNALLLVVSTAAIAIIGQWSQDAGLSGLWRIPAALLLMGLAYESWIVAKCGLRVELELPERLYLGRDSSVGFVCTHGLPRGLAIELAPSAPDSFELEDGIAALRIPRGAEASTRRRVTPGRLGVHAWPALRTRIAGPLGFAWWPKQLACGQEVRVLPDLLRGAADALGLAASGAKTAPEIGAGAEVLRLREYRDGDPPRVIDWKATARAARLISRDFAQEHRLQIVILVDAGRSSAMRAGALDRFGHYINVAARLAQHAALHEDLVGLVVYADQPLAWLAPARGMPAVARVRAVLGASSACRSESNPLYAATRVRSLVRHRSLVVMLTDVDDTTVAGQLAQAVRLLLPKHLPFVAGLSSAEAESMSFGQARQWLDPYRALAAQEYCIGLARKVRALNALGAPALVARPERLEQAVFAAYQDLRRRRRA